MVDAAWLGSASKVEARSVYLSRAVHQYFAIISSLDASPSRQLS